MGKPAVTVPWLSVHERSQQLNLELHLLYSARPPTRGACRLPGCVCVVVQLSTEIEQSGVVGLEAEGTPSQTHKHTARETRNITIK